MAAVVSGRLALLMWAVAVVAIAGASLLWARRAWDEVEVTAAFVPARAFLGEAVELHVRVANRKRFPLPIVRLGVWLPPGLSPSAAEEVTPIRGYHRTLYLPARTEALVRLPVGLTRRGEFWLERVDAEISDSFDLVPMSRELFPQAALLVMPEPRITIPIDVRRRLPFGHPNKAPRMFEEHERFAGVRPYEPGDPLNRVHWKMTAHAGRLQTKLFEPTRSADVMLVMDLSVGEPFWDSIYPEISEDVIGWTSFLAREAMRAGWRVGLMANTHYTRGRGPLRVPPSMAKGHEGAIFGALARMPNEPTADLGPVLRETVRTVGRETTVVVVSARPGPRLRHEIAVLRRRSVEVVELSPLQAALSGGSR